MLTTHIFLDVDLDTYEDFHALILEMCIKWNQGTLLFYVIIIYLCGSTE
jgi:hypothetical protein